MVRMNNVLILPAVVPDNTMQAVTAALLQNANTAPVHNLLAPKMVGGAKTGVDHSLATIAGYRAA